MALVVGQWYEYVGTPSASTSTNKGGVDVMVVSQNPTTNTSLLRIKPWAMKCSGTGNWKLDAQTMTIKANNSSVTAQTKYDLRNQTNNEKLYLTDSYPFLKYSGSGYLLDGEYVFEFTINHDTEGKATGIPIYALIPLLNTGSGKNHIVDTTIDLPQIPRKSTCVWSANYIGDPIYITISRASTSFTSTVLLQFDIGNDDWLSFTVASKTSSDSITYSLSSANLKTVLGYFTTVKQATAKIVLETYSGSTSIGTNEYTFTMNIKQENPTVSATIVDTNSVTTALTGDSSKIVKYISKPKVTISATPKNEATIKSYSLAWGNNLSQTKETTLSSVDNSSLTVTATDSRNLTGTTSYNLSSLSKWIEYIKIAYTKLNLYRTESTSNTIKLDVSGNWFNQSFGAKSNTLTLKYRYKEASGSYSSYVTLSPTKTNNTFNLSATLGTEFDYQKAYQFEFIISDLVMSITSNIDISKGTPIIRVGEDYLSVNGALNVSETGVFTNGIRNQRLNGGHGTSGYMHVCDISHTGTYVNQFITFDVLQRNRMGSVSINLASSGTVGALTVRNIRKTGNIGVHYIISNNVLSLYITKSGGYDDIEICNLSKGAYMSAVNIVWKNQTVTSLPSGYTKVIEGGYSMISAYPVGSVYMSTSSTSPADLFGGTWEQMTSEISSVNMWKRTS